MSHRPFRAVLCAAACGLMGAAWHEVQAQPAAPVCDAAGLEAEQKHGLPAGLLRAIGRAESGRKDSATGEVVPWPWTINAEGRGRMFDSLAEALAATRAVQSGGVASVDVGCFQVNLVHHPLAFASLEEGFDPQANADYAARFLVSLRAKLGDWDGAVAAYHSATPERGGPYRERVYALWTRDDGAPAPAAPIPIPLTVRTIVWTAPSAETKAAGGMKVWTPSAQGQGAAVIRMTRG